MRRAIWGTYYCLIGAGLIGAGLLLAASVSQNSEPLALTGVTCCIVSLTAAHFAFNLGWLKAARRKLDADREAHQEAKSAVASQRAMMDNEFHRATRTLEEAQRTAREEIAAEREAMLIDVAAREYEIKCEGFRAGFETKTRGLVPDGPSNVVHLPTSSHRPAAIGHGVSYN